MFIKSSAHSEDVQKPKKLLNPTSSQTDLPYIRNPLQEILVEASQRASDSQFRYIVQNYKVHLIEKGTDTLFYEVDGTLVMYRTPMEKNSNPKFLKA